MKGKLNSTQLIQIPSKIEIRGSWKPEILIDRATWDADERLPGIPKKMKRTKNAARKREEKRVEYNIIIIRSQRSDLLLFNLELGRPFFSFSFFFGFVFWASVSMNRNGINKMKCECLDRVRPHFHRFQISSFRTFCPRILILLLRFCVLICASFWSYPVFSSTFCYCLCVILGVVSSDSTINGIQIHIFV